jgi:predicted ATPase
MSHPFGDLLKQYRRRRPGLTQERLAHMIGYDEAVLVRMSQGKKDLTGPSGRDRVLRLIETLKDEGALHTLEEANALLSAAQMPPLYSGIPVERVLIQALKPAVTPPSPSLIPFASPLFTLPAPVSSFVGREDDIAEIARLLQTARLVTLTGAGGSGKTRLALEAGARQAGAFTHGACFVNLAVARQVEDVVPAIAQALNVPDAEQASLLEPIKRFIAGKSILLVLDNFEHVLEGAQVVSDLLMAAPAVKVLATSREPLRLSGEHVYIVEPLALPRAVELFTQRARAVRPAFRLSQQNEPAVMNICRRMDGLPLAIELAAARMRHFSLEALLASLNAQRGLSVLTDAPRDVPARHHTLRSAIAWSYQLLNDEEQRVLNAMGVFAGGGEIEQIGTVVDSLHGEAKDGASPALSTHLQSLVDKNLVRAIEQPDGTLRYFLLELIREFALEQLEAQGRLHLAQRAHADAYIQLAAQSDQPIRRHEQLRWHNRLDRDVPNFRVVLGWCFGPGGDVVRGCTIAGALGYFWFIATKYLNETEAWLKRAYAERGIPDNVRAGVLEAMLVNNHLWGFSQWHELGEEMSQNSAMQDARGRALAAYNLSASVLNQNLQDEDAWRLAQECLALAQASGDDWLKSMALLTLAVRAHLTHDLHRAEVLYRQIVALRRNLGNEIETSIGLWQLAGVVAGQCRLQEANVLLQESALLARRFDSPQDVLHAECAMGDNQLLMNELQRAIETLTSCAALARERLPAYDLVQPLVSLAQAQVKAGEQEAARRHQREAAQIVRSMRWPASHDVWLRIIDIGAEIALTEDDAARAAQLWGAADALWKQRRSAPAKQALMRLQEVTRSRMGDERYALAYAAGSKMEADATIALALGEAG